MMPSSPKVLVLVGARSAPQGTSMIRRYQRETTALRRSYRTSCDKVKRSKD
jgi:hypothetical protein